jgi:hypothetical protein
VPSPCRASATRLVLFRLQLSVFSCVGFWRGWRYPQALGCPWQSVGAEEGLPVQPLSLERPKQNPEQGWGHRDGVRCVLLVRLLLIPCHCCVTHWLRLPNHAPHMGDFGSRHLLSYSGGRRSQIEVSQGWLLKALSILAFRVFSVSSHGCPLAVCALISHQDTVLWIKNLPQRPHFHSITS